MSTITIKQLQTIQIARRQVEQLSGGAFDEAAFRLALRNTGGVKPDAKDHCSAKALTQVGFDAMLKLFEGYGYKRPATLTGGDTSRQLHYIRLLYQQYTSKAEKPTSLEGIVLQATRRKRDLDKLTVPEARKVIEALRGMVSRRNAGQPGNEVRDGSNDARSGDGRRRPRAPARKN